MKRFTSILLLLLLAFNWMGYRLVSHFMENSTDAAINSRIERSDFNDADLIEIRVPLNAPYLTNNSSAGFESFNGELELNGVHYKYVKRKVDNGDLVLMCLPNENKTRFQNSRADFFKLVNDLNQTGGHQDNQKGNSSIKAFAADYIQEINSWSILSLSNHQVTGAAQNQYFSAMDHTDVPLEPPRA